MRAAPLPSNRVGAVGQRRRRNRNRTDCGPCDKKRARIGRPNRRPIVRGIRRVVGHLIDAHVEVVVSRIRDGRAVTRLDNAIDAALVRDRRIVQPHVEVRRGEAGRHVMQRISAEVISVENRASRVIPDDLVVDSRARVLIADQN